MSRLGLNLTGRLTTAPCGHPGQHLIGQYVECLVPNCDGLAGRPKCSRCGSDKVEPFVAMNIPDGATHCLPCGHVQWSGRSVDEDED